MRCITIAVVCATLGLASVAHGAPAPGVGAGDNFAISGIKVDATGTSPREARDLAIAKGRAVAWSTLIRRIAPQSEGGTVPRLGDSELMGLILRADANNERRSTTRYVADVTFHFNPGAVRRALSRSNILTAEDKILQEQVPGTADSSTYLAVNVRFDTQADWAIVQERLSAADGVTGMEIVGHTANDAQIYLAYSGDVERLPSALARSALELTTNEGEYTLQLGLASATTASLQR